MNGNLWGEYSIAIRPLTLYSLPRLTQVDLCCIQLSFVFVFLFFLMFSGGIIACHFFTYPFTHQRSMSAYVIFWLQRNHADQKYVSHTCTKSWNDKRKSSGGAVGFFLHIIALRCCIFFFGSLLFGSSHGR